MFEVRTLFCVSIALLILSATVTTRLKNDAICSFGQYGPNEVIQVSEPAHALVYGFGGLPFQYLQNVALRPSIKPYFYSGVLFGCDVFVSTWANHFGNFTICHLSQAWYQPALNSKSVSFHSNILPLFRTSLVAAASLRVVPLLIFSLILLQDGGPLLPISLLHALGPALIFQDEIPDGLSLFASLLLWGWSLFILCLRTKNERGSTVLNSRILLGFLAGYCLGLSCLFQLSSVVDVFIMLAALSFAEQQMPNGAVLLSLGSGGFAALYCGFLMDTRFYQKETFTVYVARGYFRIVLINPLISNPGFRHFGTNFIPFSIDLVIFLSASTIVGANLPSFGLSFIAGLGLRCWLWWFTCFFSREFPSLPAHLRPDAPVRVK